MTRTSTAALVSDRPQGVAWSDMPRWFHGATFIYFATNFFNAWAVLELGAPAIASFCLILGLAGGLTEHISPYFPKLFVPAIVEKLLFRLPTIIGYLWVAVWMGLAWYFVAAFVVHAIVFMRQEALTSMELRYHVKHVLATHISGAVGMIVLLLLASGDYPALNALLTP